MLKEKKKLSFMSKEANPVVLAPMLAKRKPSFFSLQEESARRGRRHTCQTQLGARGLPEPFSDGTRGGAEGGQADTTGGWMAGANGEGQGCR